MPEPTIPLEIQRARQLFSFLKAFAERNQPVQRDIRNQLWTLRLRDLPAYHTITVGEVKLGRTSDQADGDDGANSAALITVRRPDLKPAPPPPETIREFVKPGWQRADGSIDVLSHRNVRRGAETIIEEFEGDPERPKALAEWRTRWSKWSEAELPALRAMEVFSRLYELHGRIERESEQVELMLGDGRLRWRSQNGSVDHPILLQRVELHFDASVPEFSIIDADRGPELYSAVLFDDQQMSPPRLKELRDELDKGGYHPLAREATSAYLRGLAQRLGAQGEFHEELKDGSARETPVVMRDPVLFLRVRPSGFAAAFDRVLQDLAQRSELPVSLTRLVGVEAAPAHTAVSRPDSPWGEPPDVLLSKPANSEQIQIARALERHGAVLVQGPPGTGKSHTIANLIGHLVAHGKRVLVTSHTTKALRVLRDQVVESLQPLCVAVLENDLEGRKQMENAVRGILSRLTTASEEQLAAEVVRLTEDRSQLNARIAATTSDLSAVREAEYLPIVISGESHDPSDAARWVKNHEAGNDWIPGPLDASAPLSLSEAELVELYSTNGTLASDEDDEIAGGIPPRESIVVPEMFNTWVSESNPPDDEFATFWSRPAAEAELEVLENLSNRVTTTALDIGRLERWQRVVVAAGHTGGSEEELWRDLKTQIIGAWEAWDRSRRLLLDHEVTIGPEVSLDEIRDAAAEIAGHLSEGGNLGALTLTFHPKWKRAIRACTVNGALPGTPLHFKAIIAHVGLLDSRKRLATRWARQATPAGLPAFDAVPSPPEPVLREYADQFDGLLAWWRRHWEAISTAMTPAGFRWPEFRQAQIARSAPVSPFERDVTILGGPLQKAVAARAAHARADRALRLIRELDLALTPYTGPTTITLRDAVQTRNIAAYHSAWLALVRLIAKKEIWERRRFLLERLRPSAPQWAEAIYRRRGVHGEVAPPVDVQKAWRWRQLQQEIERRAGLDEIALSRRLEQYRADLRKITAQLIDRRAWLGQKRRTDLTAQQALQGWADIQKRIGRGTGKRVPALQAEARKQLARARGAVPVWIMPLARVAESFDAQGRFDVVIVDESSQSDVTGLLAWYLGDKVAIVGDHEQVSPLAVGQQLAPMDALIGQYLQDIPNNVLYDGKASIYELARQSFGGTIALREHFRCVPDIIEFSNELSYNFEIRPLRNGGSVVWPHVVEYVVQPGLGSDRTGKTNLTEARLVVALLKAITELPEYPGKTLGAITLLGDEQAGLIQDLAVRVIDAVELESRRFVAGNAGQFQGDERDVIFLTMVDVPIGTRHRISQLESTKQRYNVAASRAKDQLWLVHSLDPNRDLQPGDLRYRLIDYVRNPGERRRARQMADARAESPFERAIIDRLIAAGYRVEPQVWAGGYRIDMVVSDANNQIALECDGDRYHGVDQIPADMARQAVLERAGWRFIRVRGTRFYRRPDDTTKWLLEEIEKAGIRPSGEAPDAAQLQTAAAEFRERVTRRAWEIMREQGWVPEVAASGNRESEGEVNGRN